LNPRRSDFTAARKTSLVESGQQVEAEQQCKTFLEKLFRVLAWRLLVFVIVLAICRQATSTSHLSTDEDFLSYGSSGRPHLFIGTPDPDEAENWVKVMEQIFRVMQCSEQEKVLLATFQLDCDARAWWEAASRQLFNINIEWDKFLELFNTKYFSERIREKKANEFTNLKQRMTSVAEYEAQFERLAQYAPHLVIMVLRAQLVEDTMELLEKIHKKKGRDSCAQSGCFLVVVLEAVAIRPLLSFLRWLELVAERRRLMRSGSATVGARRRWQARREGPFVVVWGTSGCSIPTVGLPVDVTTAENVATSEKVSPQLGATLSRHWWSVGLPSEPSDEERGSVPVSRAVPCVPALADGPFGGFQKGCRVCLCLLGLSWLQASCAVSVGGCDASSLSPDAQHLRACSCGSQTLCSARGAGWFYLWTLDLVKVWDVGACVVRLWSHVVAPVFRELLCLGGACRGFASALCLTALVLRKSFPTALAGTQAIFHEELSSSGRLEDGKKVPSIISRKEENATEVDDATRDASLMADALSGFLGFYHGVAHRRDLATSMVDVALPGYSRRWPNPLRPYSQGISNLPFSSGVNPPLLRGSDPYLPQVKVQSDRRIPPPILPQNPVFLPRGQTPHHSVLGPSISRNRATLLQQRSDLDPLQLQHIIRLSLLPSPSALHKYDCHLMAYLFRKSLDGLALEWFYSLPPEEAEDFQIVQERFLQQFQDRVGPEYSFVDLVAEKMKPEEEFSTYVDQWRSLAANVCCPMPEEEKVKLLISNATLTY
ncbi:hypothetical protein Taro_004722, partial [Colocasia esculenta]|nr:hypothetical protein [Colocasia esculenta]